MKRALTSFCAVAFAFVPVTAHAVTIVGGTIETAGNAGTVDLVFFRTEAAGTSDIGFVARCGLCDVITDEAVGMNLYEVTAAGAPGALIASLPGMPDENFVGFDDILLAMGNFVVAVGSYELIAGELPPLQLDTNITRSFSYEVSFTGQADGGVYCTIEGNLDGSVGINKSNASELCALPDAAVSAPGTIGLFGLALAFAISAVAYRRARAEDAQPG